MAKHLVEIETNWNEDQLAGWLDEASEDEGSIQAFEIVPPVANIAAPADTAVGDTHGDSDAAGEPSGAEQAAA